MGCPPSRPQYHELRNALSPAFKVFASLLERSFLCVLGELRGEETGNWELSTETGSWELEAKSEQFAPSSARLNGQEARLRHSAHCAIFDCRMVSKVEKFHWRLCYSSPFKGDSRRRNSSGTP